MRAVLLLAALSLAASPAGSVTFEQIFVPQGRMPLATTGPITAMVVADNSIFVAEMGGARVCEYTYAGNIRRCLDELPGGAKPLGVEGLAWHPPGPAFAFRSGGLYVAARGHGMIYRVDLHNKRVDRKVKFPARSIEVAPYGILAGIPMDTNHRVGTHSFHRFTFDLRPQWSFGWVFDPVEADSPWAPMEVGPSGEVYGASGGSFSVGRYTPKGLLKYSFGEEGPLYEDIVPQDMLPKTEWLQLWSPILRLDLIDERLMITSRAARGDITWDVIDIYSLAGFPEVRSLPLEGESPIGTLGDTLYTVRTDEVEPTIYMWKLNLPEQIPEGGLMGTPPPGLDPVREAASEVTWDEVRPYLEAVYFVDRIKGNRPTMRFDPSALGSRVPGYNDELGQSAIQAVALMHNGKTRKGLERCFKRQTMRGVPAAEATGNGWSCVMADDDLRARLRGTLCRELRLRGYPCP